MFIEPVQVKHARGKAGFTLLEIMLAVGILAMMSLAIYRFVQSNLVAVRISSEENATEARFDGLRDLLTTQWQSLIAGRGALTGEPLKLNDRSRDEISWVCGAGPGLLTRYAPGDFLVTLRLQRESNKSDRLNLGLLRKPKDDDSTSGENDSWIPLINNVSTMEIRYFDPRLNSWLDRWSDAMTLPRLVKLVITRPDTIAKWEVIIALARTPQ